MDYNRKSLYKDLQEKPHMRHLVIVDSEASPEFEDVARLDETNRKAAEAEGRVVALAIWNVYAHGRTDQELDKEMEDVFRDEMPPGCNEQLYRYMLEKCTKSRRHIMGNKPYMLLSILATASAHHRRGLGAMLLRQGLEEADGLGLPAHLEASRVGLALYERFGFETVGDVVIESERLDMTGDQVFKAMVRPAKSGRKLG